MIRRLRHCLARAQMVKRTNWRFRSDLPSILIWCRAAARVIKTFEKVKTLFSSRVAGLLVGVVHLEQMTAAGANTC